VSVPEASGLQFSRPGPEQVINLGLKMFQAGQPRTVEAVPAAWPLTAAVECVRGPLCVFAPRQQEQGGWNSSAGLEYSFLLLLGGNAHSGPPKFVIHAQRGGPGTSGVLPATGNSPGPCQCRIGGGMRFRRRGPIMCYERPVLQDL